MARLQDSTRHPPTRYAGVSALLNWHFAASDGRFRPYSVLWRAFDVRTGSLTGSNCVRQRVCQPVRRVVSGLQESARVRGQAMTVAFVFLSATASFWMPATCVWVPHPRSHYL